MDGETRRRFIRDYAGIRRAEGKGSADPEYYRALPYRDISGKNGAQWEIRARSYRHFEEFVLPPIEKEIDRPLDILDLGAGNGWMSYRLALRKHRPVALDIFADQSDGLRAVRYYPQPFLCVEAEFDQLPFADASFDMVLMCAILQLTTNDVRHLVREAARLLVPGGTFFGAWLLLDEQAPVAPDDGRAVAFEMTDMRSLLASCGLDVEAVHFGEWSGRTATLGYQDVVVVRRG